MRNYRFQSSLILMFVANIMLFASGSAQAVPAFARQMGVSCNTCHFQHFPLLNSFGRAFKASGYTMSNKNMIESEHFSLPENMNLGLFTNLRYQKTNGTTTSSKNTSNNGEWILPGETSLFIAGRVNEQMGAILEGDVGAAGAAAGSGFLAGLKLPIIIGGPIKTVTTMAVPFTTGLGPSYSFEVLNTGAVGNHVISLAHPTSVSAQQFVQVGGGSTYDGSAEGLALVAVNSDFFVNITKWSPNHSTLDAGNGSAQPTSTYLRAAMTSIYNGWDIGFGIQDYAGHSAQAPGGTANEVYTKAYAVDGQLQGVMDGMQLGVYLSYAAAPGSNPGEPPNLYNPNPNRKSAYSVAAELGAFANGRGTIQAAYRHGNNGGTQYETDNATSLGISYMPSHNVQLSLLHTTFGGNAYSPDNSTPPALEGASGSGSRLTTFNLGLGF